MKLSIALVLSAIQLAVLASPVQPDDVSLPISLNKRGSLAVNGVVHPPSLQKHLAHVASKYQRGFAAYKQNTGNDHPLLGPLGGFLPFAPIRRSTGADPLASEQNGSLWQGAISVGTPAVQYTVDFDTGSSDLFLPSTSCSTNCDGHKKYDSKSSSTSQDLHKTFSLQYGDGSSVSGEQFSDTVQLAGLTATGQVLGAANQYSNGFAISQFPPDGLMGMGFQSISDYNSPPVFQTMVAEKQTTAPVFAFKLAPTGSELFLGGTNHHLYKGAFTYVPVTIQGYWQVVLDAINVDGKSPVTMAEAIIDTGTTLVLGDSQSVAAIYADIPGSKNASSTVGAGMYTFPCQDASSIQVSLKFGGKAFPINSTYFNLGQASQGSPDCVGGIAAAPSPMSFWVVGDVFLQNVYTAFDVGQARVGFANLA